jgi:hypothetical protein
MEPDLLIKAKEKYSAPCVPVEFNLCDSYFFIRRKGRSIRWQ